MKPPVCLTNATDSREPGRRDQLVIARFLRHARTYAGVWALFASTPCIFATPTITGPNAIWWFGSGILLDGSGCPTGSSPCYYAQSALTANANGDTSGTPTWTVTSKQGGGDVSLSCLTCTNTTATSTAPSPGCTYDVSIYLTYPDNVQSSTFYLLVAQPTTLTLQSGYPTDLHSRFGVGYDSKTEWQMTDSCGNADAGLDVNEVFGTFITDYTGQNWSTPFESSANQPTSYIMDSMIGTQEGGYVPAPEYPQTPLGTTKVRHNPWLFYVGSLTIGSGLLIHTDTQQNYQDHGRHQ